MGQKPAVSSVSAGAAALGLTMGGMLPGTAGGVARTQTAPVQPVRRMEEAPSAVGIGKLFQDAVLA